MVPWEVWWWHYGRRRFWRADCQDARRGARLLVLGAGIPSVQLGRMDRGDLDASLLLVEVALDGKLARRGKCVDPLRLNVLRLDDKLVESPLAITMLVLRVECKLEEVLGLIEIALPIPFRKPTVDLRQ